MSIILCNFSDSYFEVSRHLQSNHALKMGFDQVLEFSPRTLSQSFVYSNYESLMLQRGSGYWIWKPEIILRACELTEPDDTLVYLDSGAITNCHASEFARIAIDGKIHVWKASSTEFTLNKHWIDPKVGKALGLDKGGFEALHYWAGLIVFKVAKHNVKVIQDWQEYCSVKEFLHPDSDSQYKRSGDLIWHRHDQSLLNILINSKRRYFTLHNCLADEPSPLDLAGIVIHHRRGNMLNLPTLRAFLFVRLIKRKFESKLPRHFRYVFRLLLMSKNKKKSLGSGELFSHNENSFQ